MSLVAEIIGVLAAGTAIGMVVVRSTSCRPQAAATGVAVAVVAVVSVLFFENGWSMISAYPAATRADQVIPKAAAETAAGATNVGFLVWARSKMVSAGQPPSFTMIPQTVRNDAFTYQWSTYQLLPAFETTNPSRADWLVFYDVDAGRVPYDRARFTRLTVYSAGFALAERTRDG